MTALPDTCATVATSLAPVVTARFVDEQLRLGVTAESGRDERMVLEDIIRQQLDVVAGERIAASVPLLSLDDENIITARVLSEVLGLGRIQPLLDRTDVSDIHIRGNDPVWLRRRDGAREQVDPVVDTDEHLVELVRLAAVRMGNDERRFDRANPEINLQLPDGSRLFAVMSVSRRPSVTIRRHRFDLMNLAELVARGMLGTRIGDFLRAAVLSRRNIVIAGGTGSGKTTLLRSLLNEVPAAERIVTIEDAYELGIERYVDLHPNVEALQSRPDNTEGRGAISMADLTRMALRMDPDRVVLGEVRGGEAFPMLMAMSQGNNGSMCTMHAESSRSVFPKLAAYVSMAETGLPVDTVNMLMAHAVHLVVHVEVHAGLRRVTSIREVVDADGGRIVSNEVFALDSVGELVPAYPLRDSTVDRLEEVGLDVTAVLGITGRYGS